MASDSTLISCKSEEIDTTLNTSQDSDDNFEYNLQIDISPNEKKRKSFQLDPAEKTAIENISSEFEQALTEKAEKANLKINSVKHILKQVVTNEHVLALVRNADNPLEKIVPVYEPKLTRSRTKVLLSDTSVTPVQWLNPKPSETHVLVTEELPEDSEDEEYVPGDEPEDDKRSVASENDSNSLPPATPPTPVAVDEAPLPIFETQWSDDGIFKIPQSNWKPKVDEAIEEPNVALRTRSKINLTSTPLEVIEKAFIPPDITTDMYELDCADTEWKEFLNGFQRPIDEIATGNEDEEQDPEYNILADGEIDKLDKEELRVDKAVIITKKEVKELWEELFEFIESCTDDNDYPKKKKNNENDSSIIEAEDSFVDTTVNSELENTFSPEVSGPFYNTQCGNNGEVIVNVLKIESIIELPFSYEQVLLLEQQMRQHVQILTQNYILTYQHPELHDDSSVFKNQLIELKTLGSGKAYSLFNCSNLEPALSLISDWENLLRTDVMAHTELVGHHERTMKTCINRKIFTYQASILRLPELVLQTMANSEVFMYASLLPPIPFRSKYSFLKSKVCFTDTEDRLIVFGLDYFEQYLKQNHDRRNYYANGKIRIFSQCEQISKHLMPHKSAQKIQFHIYQMRSVSCAMNPIKQYYENDKRLEPFIHQVLPFDVLKAPCKQKPELLPDQWKDYLEKKDVHKSNHDEKLADADAEESGEADSQSNTHVIINTLWSNHGKYILPLPDIVDIIGEERKTRKTTKTKAKEDENSTQVDCNNKFAHQILLLQKFVKVLSSEIPVSSLVNLFNDVECVEYSENCISINKMASMPALNTPVKTACDINTQDAEVSSSVSDNNSDKIDKETHATDKMEAPDITPLPDTTVTKDNPDDINALMVASSTVKSTVVKKESVANEKKKAKLRKEYLANLALTAPDDPDTEMQNSTMFAIAYYDKMRETLELSDYESLMQILGDHESGDAVDLYKSVIGILSPKYQQLADEFLLFLRAQEAAAVGKLIPWIRMTTRSKFLWKLEMFFKDQPTHLTKVYKNLTELSQNPDITMDRIRATMLPLLKGNTVLIDLFLQNFLCEKPPLGLLEGPYESIDVTKEMARPEEEQPVETVVIPDVEDKYGNSSCICQCHKIEDPEFKQRQRHCLKCGLKFIQGRVYVQTGKGLRQANVTFESSPEIDHKARLSVKMPITAAGAAAQRKKQRSESSPSKPAPHPSTSKETVGEETEEDETDGKKKPVKSRSRSPRKRKKTPDRTVGKSKRVAEALESPKAPKQHKPRKRTTTNVPRAKKIVQKAVTVTQEELLKHQECVISDAKVVDVAQEEEKCEPEISVEPVEMIEKPVTSPEIQTAESESEFCEESSQDNCATDTNSSDSHSDNEGGNGVSSWRRDEDKIILETFQQEDDKEYAFQLISEKLAHRTIRQIRSRFSTLMELLLDQIGSS